MPVRYTKSTPDYPNKRPRLENKPKSKSSFIFTNASQIRASLRQDDPEALTEALTSLRNQLSVKHQEEHDHTHTAISPTDERLTLAKEWMETSPGAQDLFAIWDNSPTHPNSNSNSRSPSSPLTPLILTLLSSLLTLLSAHYPLHPLGHPILRTLLAPARLRTLNAFLGGANNELIITTLRLYNAMSNWAGGKERKAVLEGFGWEVKSLPKLLNMRRKTHGEKDLTDPLIRPDIRTLYILLLLSFLSPSTPSPIKSLFLEHHRPAFIAIFKGLAGDHYALVRRVLETCWTGVWCDPRVKRSVGVAVFGEGVLGCLVKLYDRNVPENPPSTTPPSKKDHQEQEDGEEEQEQEQEQEQEPQIPADLVHHFLLAICTRPGTGICFKDRGWYPRSSDSEGASEGAFEGTFEGDTSKRDPEDTGGAGRGRGSRIYNKILANFVKTLRVNEDPRQQELVLKILEACPELVVGYWSSIGLTLEPRLSSKWITNIAVFGSIVSLPVPVDTFLLPGSITTTSTTAGSAPFQRQYNPTPPPLSTILANILPTQSVKQNLTKGLLPSSSGHAQAQAQAKSGAGQTQTQSPTLGLTQHLTALALCRCLLKYDAVMREMRRVSEALEEEDAGVGMDFDGGVETEEGQSRGREGQWARRMREVEREVRRRVPEWGVCVGFAMGVGVGVGAGGNTPNVIAPAPTSNPTKTALLAESAQRLLWLYHRCLPSVVAEVRFDVGKLLQTFVQGPSSSAARGDEDEEMQADEREEEEPDAASRLYRVQQLHILGLLKQSDQFVWSTKIPSLSQTPFHVLLTALSSSGCTGIGTGNSTSSTAIRKALADVLQRILSQSILFQEDPDEPELWLRVLPQQQQKALEKGKHGEVRSASAAEAEGVVSFLDECVQRCLKTPYKYVEALHALVNATVNVSGNGSTSSASASASGPTSTSTLPQILNLKHLPSPLLMTLLEQLEAKTKSAHAHASLPASHLVGIAVYMRKLIFNLAGKTPGGLEVLRAVVDRLDGALSSDRLSGYEEKEKEKGVGLDVRDQYDWVGVVRREVGFMRVCLAFGSDQEENDGVEEDVSGAGAVPDVQAYLDHIEVNPIPRSPRQRTSQALAIVDWIRNSTAGYSLTTSDLRRVLGRVIVLDRSVLDDGVQNLIPGRGQVDLWAALDLDLPGRFDEVGDCLDFPYLFLHSTSRHITDEACQSVLAQSVFPASPSRRSEIKVKLVDITRCIYLIAHRLSSVLHQEYRGQEERGRSQNQSQSQSKNKSYLIKGLFALLARILERSQEVLSSPEDMMLLKEVVFLHAGVVKDVMMSSALGGDEDEGEVIQGIQRLIDASLDPAVEGDRRMVADISGYWFNVLTHGQGQGQDLDSSAEPVPIALACLWVKFLSPERLFDLLDVVQRKESRNQNGVRPSVSVLRPIEVVLEALCVAASAFSSSSSLLSLNGGQEGPGPGQEEQEGCDTETLLLERLPQLLALRSSFMRDSVLLEQVLAIAVQAALPIGLDGCLPVVMSSSSSSSAAAAAVAPGHMDLVHLTQRAEGRWATRHRRHSSRCGRSDVNMDVDNVDLDLDIRTFLFQPTYSQWTVKIICALIYQQSNLNSNSNSTSLLRDVLREWLGSSALQRPVEHVLPIMYAFLDSGGFSESQDEETEGAEGDEGIKTTVDDELWTPFIPILVRTLGAQDVPAEQHRQAQASLVKMVSSIADFKSSTALEVLERECRALPEKNVTPALLSFGVGLHTHLGGKSKSKVEGALAVLIERGIKACIDHFGDALVTVEGSRVAVALTALLRRARVAKAHLVETLLTVTIQSRFANVVALRLATACLSACQLKPVVVNRHLQSIIQHPYFFKICSGSSSSSSSNSNASLEHGETREALIGLLHHLFTLHPTNTCQITHIEPLIRVYGGTLSLADRRMLSVFGLFERERKVSVTPLLSRWSADGAGHGGGVSQTALEALQSLDPILVLRTTLNFPRWRRLGDQLLGVDVDGASAGAGIGATADEAVLYDPIFLMLLFGQMLSDHPPTSAIGWIELFRTNVVSLFIRALSARDGRIRELALSQVVGVWRHMETADLQEQPHVMHILNLLKDLMPAPSTSNSPSDSDPEYPRRLPTYTSLLLLHSLRAIFHPSQFIYPHTARFLLQRPSLDVSDVPMLYGLLYSSSDENMGWKKERAWMIRFLADGMVGSEDWRVLKRRHTWDLLASLFQSALEGRDGPLRMGILEVLANLTCNAQATTSLILKSALLQWIEMQLLYSTTKAEGVEWIKILENILVIVDASKLEVATNGDWRSIICRCLACLLDQKSCATASDNFFHAVPVILRLASLPGPALRDLPSLLDLAVTCLKKWEASLSHSIQINGFQGSMLTKQQQDIVPLPPHRSLTLHRRLSDVITSQPFGQEQLFIALLEMLWKASMLIQNRSDAWEKLTPRMLLWNSARFTADLGAAADVDVNVAEWARKEVIFNIRSQGRVE